MFSFLKNILRKNRAAPDPATQKRDMTSTDPVVRAQLAGHAETLPEILYYLARDEDASVRRAVAQNQATPVHAAALMAQDQDADVRLVLAARLVDLLPGLSTEEHSQLYAYTVQALGVLAQDEVLKIRKALSTALVDCADAPPSVAAQLARDVEREVSEPVLRFCVALSDDDLLDILSGHPEPWVISAIAGRETVSEAVSDAVVKTEDAPAQAVLIGNKGALIADDALKVIIDRARDFPEWHGKLAMRKELSFDLARQLSGFVEVSVLDMLKKRTDYTPPVRTAVADLVQRRMAYTASPGGQKEPAEERLKRYAADGNLGPEVIHDAIVWQDTAFVVLALAFLARVNVVIVKKMLHSGAARPIIALCHKAGLPMRLAVVMQTDFERLKPKDLIYAKGGTDYPLTEDEIQWQLEFFGVV